MKYLLPVALFLGGCNFAINADELLEQIEKCELAFNDECSLIAVPNGGEQEMRSMYEQWGSR